MKISLVIPVYNEALALDACLSSIASQIETPFEVIVVDNNSTDSTAAIAQSYPFVKLIQEPRQGVVHARNTGFDAASGDIIGRIDADTILPPGWTAQVSDIFKADKTIAAVSGSPHYYDFALSRVADGIDAFLRMHLATKLGQENFLWGANMAVKRSAWQAVRSQLCAKRLMHEDFDLAIHLQSAGYRVTYDENLVAGVSSRRIDSTFSDYARYTLRSPRTYAMHSLKSRRHMYPVIAVCWLAYLPGRLIYRGWDPLSGSFSLTQLVNGSAPTRVDPTVNVI